MAYPSVVTSFTNPNPTDRLNSPSHSSIESAQNTGLTELQTFVGTLSSVAGTLMYDIRAAASNGGGHVQTANKGGTGQTTFNKGDMMIAQSSSILTKLAVGTDNQVLTADSSQSVGVRWGSGGKNGGTGSDGALVISSGTTTIDCANAAFVTKNYTSISITGTGALGFSNPHTNGTTIILKSQGAVTLTSSSVGLIVGTGLGGAGGAASTSTGNTGSGGITWNKNTNGGNGGNTAGPGGGGGGGTYYTAGSNGTGGAGTGGAAVASLTDGTQLNPNFYRFLKLACGAGGASGGSGGGNSSGAGGNGGAAIYIECGGAWNFTGTIVSSGASGSSGGANTGGGGGGGGGMVAILYNSLTASSGTITVAGGGGAAGSGGGGTGGGGAAGNSILAANVSFT